MLKIDCKIFVVEMQIGMVGVVFGLGCYFVGEVGLVGVVDQCCWVGVLEDVNLCVKGVGEIGGNFVDLGFDLLLYFIVVSVQCFFQFDVFWQYVSGIVFLDLCYVEYY